MNMRVLLINYEYPPVGAGAANATFHMARNLVELGHEVTVLTARFRNLRGWAREAGVEVFRCLARRQRKDRSNIFEMLSFLGGAFLALRRVNAMRKPDATIAFFSVPSGPVAMCARMLWRVPYVVSLRGGDVPGSEKGLAAVYWLLTPLRRLTLRCATAVVANSVGLKDMSERADPVPVLVVPNGVDTEFFRPAAKRHESSPVRLLFVGRFQPQKNIPVLLDQIAALRARPGSPPMTLEIIGNGPLRGEIEARVAQLGLNDVVVFRGWLDRVELRDAYQSADCVVNPSLYEGMPNVVLEAMACGTPVVASRVAGNETLVRDGQTGLLFNLEQPGALATCLLRLAVDPDMRRTMGARARQAVEAGYTWRRVAEEYVTLLNPRA